VRLVLAFDTATEVIACAIGRWPDAADTGTPELLAELSFTAPRAANTKLLPSVLALLREASLDIGQLDAVVVGRGPGSFTGVRIAVATAKGLAQGLAVPLYGAGTLDAIARRFSHHEGLVGIVGDAMRQEVYPALFRCGGGVVRRLAPDTVTRPRTAAESWAAETSGPLLLAGDGLAKHAAVFADVLGERAQFAAAASWTPPGEGLLAVAFDALPEAGPGDPSAMLPIYTRLADAEEAEARRRGRTARLTDSGVSDPTEGRR
jgi:tRNA threonylcarbamoyl adenosine modification protein YeaZ